MASTVPQTNNTSVTPDNLKTHGDQYNAHYHVYDGVTLLNGTGGQLVAGDVVALSTAADGSTEQHNVVRSLRTFVVAQATVESAASGEFARAGRIVAKSTGTIALREFIRKSATAKTVEGTGILMGTAAPPVGALGVALAAASGGLVLVDWYGVPVGTSVIACRVRNTSNQNIPNTTETALAFTAERFDTGDLHASSPSQRITFTVPGKYLVGGHVNFSGDYSAAWMSIRLNGSTFLARSGGLSTALGSITTLYDFAAGDYVELTVFFQDGTDSIPSNNAYSPEFWAVWLGS